MFVYVTQKILLTAQIVDSAQVARVNKTFFVSYELWPTREYLKLFSVQRDRSLEQLVDLLAEEFNKHQRKKPK